jgi:hypothetical protein
VRSFINRFRKSLPFGSRKAIGTPQDP